MTLQLKVMQVLLCHCSHRTSVTSKPLSNLNWMICYKHVLVINREYYDIVIKMRQ